MLLGAATVVRTSASGSAQVAAPATATRLRSPTSAITSNTDRSAQRKAAASPTGSGACCRSSSRTSSRSVPASATSGSAFCRTARRTAVRSARRSVRAAAIASASTAPRVMSARSANARQPAPRRARHARESDGSAGLRALPDGLRAGSALQRRHADRRDPQGESRFRFLLAPVLPLLHHPRDEERHPRSRPRQRLVRRPPAVRPRPRRYLQSLQGAAAFADGERQDGGDGGSAVTVESEAAAGAVAALGRQQRSRRGAQQERGDWRRRHARFARPAFDDAHRRMDSGTCSRPSIPRHASIPRRPRPDAASGTPTARRVTRSGSPTPVK